MQIVHLIDALPYAIKTHCDVYVINTQKHFVIHVNMPHNSLTLMSISISIFYNSKPH